MGLPTIFRHLLTESDNITHDVFRYLAVLCIFVGLGLEVYVIVLKEPSQPFDFMTFGTGVGVILTGTGAALALRRSAAQALNGPENIQTPPTR